MPEQNKVNVGDHVRDEISGYEGIALARTEWLYGCVRVHVQSKELKDGKPVDVTFDEDQLQVIKAKAIQPKVSMVSGLKQLSEEVKQKGRTGGDRDYSSARRESR